MIALLKKFCYQSSFNNTCYFLATPPITQNYATQLSSKRKHLKLTLVSIPRKIYEKTHFIVIVDYKMYKAKVYGIIYTCQKSLKKWWKIRSYGDVPHRSQH